MKTVKLLLLGAIGMGLFLAGCSDRPSSVTDNSNTVLHQEVSESDNSANTGLIPFSVPAPPIPVTVDCLDENLQGEGTWNGWLRFSVTSTGHVHITEYIDYSAVTFRGTESGRTWQAAPGAHENLIFNVPAGFIESGETSTHEINARYLGPEGYPDLIISHSIHLVWDADGQLRVSKIGIPFQGRCLGSDN